MGNIDWKFLYTDYNGRIPRSQWWLGMVGVFVLSILSSWIFGVNGILPWLISIILLFLTVCLHIKRCHDRDQSGWWILLLFIPVIGFLWALINLGLLEGTRGDNRFGADPLDGV